VDGVAYGASNEVEVEEDNVLRLLSRLEVVTLTDAGLVDDAEAVDDPEDDIVLIVTALDGLEVVEPDAVEMEAVDDPEDDAVVVVTTIGWLDIVAKTMLPDGDEVDAPNDELVDNRMLDSKLELIERVLLMLVLLELGPPQIARN